MKKSTVIFSIVIGLLILEAQIPYGQSQPTYPFDGDGLSIDKNQGGIWSGEAISETKNGKTWPFKLTLIGPDKNGSISGQIEWPSLGSIHRITGYKTTNTISFTETGYIQKGGAVLNCNYDVSIMGNSFNGKWYGCDDGDYGTINGRSESQDNGQENQPPTISMFYSPEFPTDTDTITLIADASDPDKDQLTYSWFLYGNEISGVVGNELQKKFLPGDYEYTVKVSDGKGGTAEDTVRFTVVKTNSKPPCDRLRLDLKERQGSTVIAKVVDICEYRPLEGVNLEIRIFHVYDAQQKKWINGEYVDYPDRQTKGNGEAIIPVNGNPGDMYRVDVYASKPEWDTSDSSIHLTIGDKGLSFDGKWNTNFGTLTLVQQGDQITGEYTHDNGKIKGKVIGNVLKGSWSEAPTRQPPNDAGEMEFQLDPKGRSFEGKWRYDSSGEWKTWNGELIERNDET